MKFMMIVKGNAETEAGVMPSEELLNAMTAYNEELVKAGVLLDGTGLHPSSKGFRIQYKGRKKSVVDGPFAEAKELIAGYWLIQVKSREEAMQWAMRIPAPHGPGAEGQVEVRQLFDLEDFGESPAIDRARKLEEKMPNRK